MNELGKLFDNNRRWAKRILRTDAHFFDKLVRQQAPRYLWIGCSDSRVPANEIVGLLPGELFVHRNVGNLVVHTDLNCLSVLQFGVDVLKIRHIIVCGHYGCSGVRAAMRKERHGLVDNWLRHIQDVRKAHPTKDLDRLCELNVLEQVANVCRTSIVENAWARGQALTVHGWIYGIQDGLLRDLGFTVGSRAAAGRAYRRALKRL